jgi:hypothetical protein
MPERLAITCVSRLLPLTGTGTLSAKQNLHSPVAVSGKRDIRWGGREEKKSSDYIIKQDSANVA